MNQRHPFNQNLFLHAEPTWQGFTVYDQRGPLIQNYLERIHQVIHNAVGEYPRTWVVRCDLHFLQMAGSLTLQQSPVLSIHSKRSWLRMSIGKPERESASILVVCVLFG